MKVLHVIDSLGRGGAEQVLATVLPELRRQGVGVGLLVRGGAMDLAPGIMASGIGVTVLKRRHRWNLIGTALEIARHARQERADVVHAHLYFPAVTVAMMRMLRLSGARSCVTFHNLAYAGANRPTLGLAFRRRLAAFVYGRGMDRCLAVSTAVAEHYRDSLGLGRVDVLPNPVDVGWLRGQVAQVARGEGVPARCRIVLPGRVTVEKGHADLLDALLLLRGRGIVPEVTVAGDGPLRGEIEARVQAAGLADQITFLGAQDHADLVRVMAGADIVVVPSRFEGFGLVALEAMALGRVVIASQAGGLPETLGETGLLVPVGEPGALADAIARLVDDPALRAELGARAAARAATFDLPVVTRKLRAVYAELAPVAPQHEGRV